MDMGWRFDDRQGAAGGWMPGDGRQFSVYAADFAAGNGKIDTDKIAASFSNQALENMGLSPSAAMAYLVRDACRDNPEQAGQAALKLAPAETNNVRSENQEKWEEEQRQQQKQWEQKQWEQKQWLENQRLEEQRFEEKRLAEQKAAANRPAEDATNNRLMMMPFALAGGLMLFGLGTDAVEAAGAAMSPNAEALSDPTMVTSNNNGGLLAAARNAVTGTQAVPGQDVLVTGPNQAAAFTPGVAPQSPAPGTTPQAPGLQASVTPGLNGPTLTPGGMI